MQIPPRGGDCLRKAICCQHSTKAITRKNWRKEGMRENVAEGEVEKVDGESIDCSSRKMF